MAFFAERWHFLALSVWADLCKLSKLLENYFCNPWHGTCIYYRQEDKMKNIIRNWMIQNIKKYGLKMGIFVIVWFIIGNFVIPPLVASLGHWEFAWITYTPIDEIVLFPIAYVILR